VVAASATGVVATLVRMAERGKPDRQRRRPQDGGRGGSQGAGRGKGGAGRPARKDGPDETVAQLTGPLQQVLKRLPETQRRVLELRMGLVDGHPHDLSDTARELGLSLSEARDIEKRAFEHIREAIPLQQLQRFLER
jgi:DNA-directed RNA polymerase specialized sigma24 family protein